jgi:hypothetical protein
MGCQIGGPMGYPMVYSVSPTESPTFTREVLETLCGIYQAPWDIYPMGCPMGYSTV